MSDRRLDIAVAFDSKGSVEDSLAESLSGGEHADMFVLSDLATATEARTVWESV